MGCSSSKAQRDYIDIMGDSGGIEKRKADTEFHVFYASIVDGQMWCSDCREAEPTIKKYLTDADIAPAKVTTYHVGTKPEWKDPENKYRKEWQLTAIPTIVKVRRSTGKEVGRLVEDDCKDPVGVEKFVNSF